MVYCFRHGPKRDIHHVLRLCKGRAQLKSQQEQAILRYNYLLSVTKDPQGDFARTSDGWANQVRVLTERFNALKAAIGQGLIAVLTRQAVNFIKGSKAMKSLLSFLC